MRKREREREGVHAIGRLAEKTTTMSRKPQFCLDSTQQNEFNMKIK